MAFRKYNANPYENDTGDCVVRAISTFLEISWDEAYLKLMLQGYKMKLYPTNNNFVWGTLLHEMGCRFGYIPNNCPNCITVEKFANGHPHGRYILGTTTHAIPVVDGVYIDTWDSGQEYPVYFFTKGDSNNE